MKIFYTIASAILMVSNVSAANKMAHFPSVEVQTEISSAQNVTIYKKKDLVRKTVLGLLFITSLVAIAVAFAIMISFDRVEQSRVRQVVNVTIYSSIIFWNIAWFTGFCYFTCFSLVQKLKMKILTAGRRIGSA